MNDLLKVGDITLLGVLHYRYEFAVRAHRLVRELRPGCVCVEFPAPLRDAVRAGARRLPHHSLISFTTASGATAMLLAEGSDGVFEAVRSADELNIPLVFVDTLPRTPPDYFDILPESYLIDKLGQQNTLTALRRAGLQSRQDEDNRAREQFMAAQMLEAARRHGTVLFVGGLAHLPGLQALLQAPQPLPLRRPGAADPQLKPLHPDALKHGLADIPRLVEEFERWRAGGGTDEPPDRHDCLVRMMGEAMEYYRTTTGDTAPDYARITWAKFLRKWLPATGRLLPDLYHLVAGARAAFDEDFAFHCHEYFADYAWENPRDEGVSMKFPVELLGPHALVVHKRMRSLLTNRGRGRLRAVGSKSWRQHLRQQWQASSPDEIDICSYPPEDVIIERWGEAMCRHARNLIQATQRGAQPFIADFGAGPDLRETLRRFHEQRLYVKTEESGGLEFGSVVVVFEPDEGEKYPFAMTWHGEHAQESDMAFYATAPGENVVGPGITRLEYGAFLLSYPPQRMLDIWREPEFRIAETRAERLLLAGIAYSEQKGIVYVAKKPPAAKWKRLAQRMGTRVVFVPLGSLNPAQVKRMRTFHLLRNKGVRAIASDYI